MRGRPAKARDVSTRGRQGKRPTMGRGPNMQASEGNSNDSGLLDWRGRG